MSVIIDLSKKFGVEFLCSRGLKVKGAWVLMSGEVKDYNVYGGSTCKVVHHFSLSLPSVLVFCMLNFLTF